MMRPDQCGFGGVPPGHPDYEVVQNFAQFLAEYSEVVSDRVVATDGQYDTVERTKDPAKLAAFQDRWGDYMAGDAPGPTVPDDAPLGSPEATEKGRDDRG
jgi:hypothetical protein